MKKIFSVVLLSGFFLSGCLTANTEVSVKKDGSGVVRQTFMMKNEFVQMLASLRNEEEYSLLNEEELLSKAEKMGDGVVFVGAEPAERDGFSGYIATYRFNDIENLKLNQNPGEDVPDEASDSDSAKEIIWFSFEQGKTNKLTVHLPEQEFERGREPESSIPMEAQEEFIETFHKIYKDMNISMLISVEGGITETNAAYRRDNTVTLIEIDFRKIADDADKVKELARVQPETMTELKAFIAEVPTMKAELQEEVRIFFQ